MTQTRYPVITRKQGFTTLPLYRQGYHIETMLTTSPRRVVARRCTADQWEDSHHYDIHPKNLGGTRGRGRQYLEGWGLWETSVGAIQARDKARREAEFAEWSANYEVYLEKRRVENEKFEAETGQVVHLFSNGSEYTYWQEHNCCRCKLYKPDSELGTGCPIEEAIALAAATNGKVTEEMAKRMGKIGPDGKSNVWFDCNEFEAEA